MGYNIENYRKVRKMLEERRLEAVRTAETRTERIHAASPEIAEIDRALATTGMQLFREATAGGANIAERIAKVRADHENLRAVRADLWPLWGLRPTTPSRRMPARPAATPDLWTL